LKNSLLLDLCV